MWDLLKYKNNVALADDQGLSVTYGELEEYTKLLSQHIGGRVLCFILCKNSIGSILGYVSCLQNNIVPLMLNEKIDQDLLLKLINIYKPKFLYCSEDFKFNVRSGKVIVDNDIICSVSEEIYRELVYKTNFGFCLYKIEYIINKKGYINPCSQTANKYFSGYPLYKDLALLLTTSGSTGSPKFVRQSYKNIESNTKSIVEYLHLDENERAITSLPMNYTYGLSVINSHLMVGATICVTDKTFMQKEFWSFAKEKKVTSLAGVPYNYEILDKLRFTQMDLPHLKTMTQAGGKLSTDLHKKFAEYAKDNNKEFVVMYGQCEATARMSYLPPEKALDKIGSMGIAIPDGKFHLKDVDGSYINEPDKEGELVYEGENVTLGYAENGEDLIKGDERNGILETGDIAKFDKDGFYYITGRKKRFLKVFGNRVNLDELERILKSKFQIDLALGGIDDNVVIFVLDDSNSSEILHYIEETTKLNHKAFVVKLIKSIPHNESGKVLYNELNELI